ncbi:MAG: radical SAM protein, partial [Candidatus Omnitrophica bacterium]|nr:radical SAM protein [Candidatus Omnitrophota bacterium]
YDGIDFQDYPRNDALPLQFSRGCIRNCAFCSERLLYKGFRMREPQAVVDEISYYRSRGINNFIFFDSMINADIKKLEDLCNKVIANFSKVNWEAQIAIRPDMPQRLFDKMKQSGCYNLFVGLESGCDDTLKRMKKGYSTEDALGFFRKLKAAGLYFGISMIVGYPGETGKDFRDSLDFIIRNKEFIPKIEQVNPFTYYEGTQADKKYDYKVNRISLKRFNIFIEEIRRNRIKHTNAFLGNLIEK